MKGITRNTHVIDATDKVPGRLATEIAVLLMGKQKVEYEPHLDIGDMVVVENISALNVSKKKLVQKMYHDYSGYPGGMKSKKANELSPTQVLERTIFNMLPKNKLRARMIKRLTIR